MVRIHLPPAVSLRTFGPSFVVDNVSYVRPPGPDELALLEVRLTGQALPEFCASLLWRGDDAPHADRDMARGHLRPRR
jgi:hypothetical protein